MTPPVFKGRKEQNMFSCILHGAPSPCLSPLAVVAGPFFSGSGFCAHIAGDAPWERLQEPHVQGL